jgi:prefoldin beta subunit
MKSEDKINQLQLLEQNMQQYSMQKQQFQGQLIEIESALSELKSTTDAYKIVGNIMVKSSKADLDKELTSKKDVVELRIKTLEKQEQRLKDKAKEIRSEVMGEMENGKQG